MARTCVAIAVPGFDPAIYLRLRSVSQTYKGLASCLRTPSLSATEPPVAKDTALMTLTEHPQKSARDRHRKIHHIKA